MRGLRQFALIWAVIATAAGLTAAGASAASPGELREPPPFWMTDEIEQRIIDAGPEGVSLGTVQGWVDRGLAGVENQGQTVQDPCPTVDAGYKTPAPTVKAGACHVAPFGCTANFIRRAARSAARPIPPSAPAVAPLPAASAMAIQAPVPASSPPPMRAMRGR